MRTFRVKGQDINLTISGDFIKVNDNGQIEIWKNYSIIAVFSKDSSVFETE